MVLTVSTLPDGIAPHSHFQTKTKQNNVSKQCQLHVYGCLIESQWRKSSFFSLQVLHLAKMSLNGSKVVIVAL